MLSDRWLKLGTSLAVIACVAFALACGGGGGGGGGTQVAFLNGSVGYVSGSAKPSAKPGGGVIYKVSQAPGDTFVAVPNAIVQLFTIDDTDFSNPIAETTSDGSGNYVFRRGHFLPGYSYADYVNVPLVVRAMFMKNDGKYVAVRQLADMLDSQAADVDPLTTAIVQKIFELFDDLGLDLTLEQYNNVRVLVLNLLETADAEALATETSLVIDETLFEIDNTVYNGGAHIGIDPLLSNAVLSRIIDSAMASLETETSDLVIGNDAMVVNKYINWLSMMGFLVDDGGGYPNGKVYVRVPEFIPDGVGGEVDVIAVLTTQFGADVQSVGGGGLAYNTILVDLDVVFALDGGAVDPIDFVDLAAIGVGQETSPLALAIREVWNIVQDSKSVISKAVVEELAIARRNERVTVEEVAEAVSDFFEWYTEDMVTVDGMVQHFDSGERPLDEDRDGQGPEIKVSTILAELVGTVPASPYDYAVEIASSDVNIFWMAEDAFMDIVFREFEANGAFDPHNALFKWIDSFTKAKNIVMGNYAAVPGIALPATTAEPSDVYARNVEGIKQILLASLPSDWFGSVVSTDTEVGFKPAMLMVIKVVDQDYLLDKTLGFMRPVTVDTGTIYEPRWDNFKWPQPKDAIENPAVPINGVNPVIKAFFERLFDGVNPDGTILGAAFVYDAGNQSGIDLAVLESIREYNLWFDNEYYPGMDMVVETGNDGTLERTNGHITFQALYPDGTVPAASDFTDINILDGGGADTGDDASIDGSGYVKSETGVPLGLATGAPAVKGTDYRFQFVFDPANTDRNDSVEFFVYLSAYLPDDNPIDGVGELDLTAWGDVFYLPPRDGGFQDFPYVGMIPDDQWWENTSYVNVGISLEGFETGMLFVPQSSGYNMRLETTATNTIALRFYNCSAVYITDPSRGRPWRGLNSIEGKNLVDPDENSDASDSYFSATNSTSVWSRTVAPSNFLDATDGGTAPDLRGVLIGVTDSTGKKFVVELNWMDPYDNFLDCRLAKVDSMGMVTAPIGTGFTGDNGTGGILLMSGDFVSLVTGEWSPPIFCPESGEPWAVAARAVADLEYNQGFDPGDPVGTDLKTIFPVNGALIGGMSIDNLDSDDYDGWVDVGVTVGDLDLAVSSTPIDLVSAPPDYIVVKSVVTGTDTYFLLKVLSVSAAVYYNPDFYPGEVEFDMSWDEDSDGVPDKIPGP